MAAMTWQDAILPMCRTTGPIIVASEPRNSCGSVTFLMCGMCVASPSFYLCLKWPTGHTGMIGTEIDTETGTGIGDHTEMQKLTGNAGEALVGKNTASSRETVLKAAKQTRVILRSLRRTKEELLLA